MHALRVLVAIILLVVAWVCLVIGFLEAKYYLPDFITKCLVAVFLALLSVALIIH
jgi:hypothetical protein